MVKVFKDKTRQDKTRQDKTRQDNNLLATPFTSNNINDCTSPSIISNIKSES